MPYADVNGVSLYFEEHGHADSDEPPIILLHGGFGAGEMFQPMLAAGLGEGRRVITVDLQGHGRTPVAAEREMTAEAMGDDVAALVKYLGLEQVDLLGYSLGGGAAARVAIQHEELVRRLVLISVPARRDGWFPEVTAQMDQMGVDAAEPMKQSPMYELYARIAPEPGDWPVLVGKIAALNQRPYDWSGEIAALTVPVLLVFADADGIRPAHMVEFFGLLGGGQKDPGWEGTDRTASRLSVIPGATHYDLMFSPLLPPTVRSFLQ